MLDPGIYFGLPYEQYDKDTALRKTGIKDLQESGMEFWLNSNMNTKRKRKTTEEQLRGQKFHSFLFEPKEFHSNFHIHTISSEKEWGNRPVVALSEYEDFKAAKNILETSKVTAQMLVGGYPEVSIIWDDPHSGVRLKSRHDYFKPLYSVDHKTIYSLKRRIIGYQTSEYGYDIQAQLYIQAREEIRKALKGGKAKIYGQVEKKFINEFLNSEDDEFFFIFQLPTSPFAARFVRYNAEMRKNAAAKIYSAVELYMRCMAKYGTEQCWPAGEEIIEEFGLEHMPRAIYE